MEASSRRFFIITIFVSHPHAAAWILFAKNVQNMDPNFDASAKVCLSGTYNLKKNTHLKPEFGKAFLGSPFSSSQTTQKTPQKLCACLMNARASQD